ncbi:MAG: sigma 54-interacting transcriptional regulator [Deltaproteobacteria bacterium]|nr:sigma 54-interacting transcriptional regulator [Deltaproteobacteria bacterium]
MIYLDNPLCDDLKKQTLLYSAIISSMREGVVTIDKNWKITYFSPRAESITGTSASSATGKQCSEIFGSSLCSTSCPVLNCLEKQSNFESRNTVITCSGGRLCHIIESSVPLKNDSGEEIGALILLEGENISDKPHTMESFFGIIGKSRSMQKLFEIISKIAPYDSTVFITGESGTGKELIARSIHRLSNRKNSPFYAINCAALPENILESELFGHVKGAFTGAHKDRTGIIEAAMGGSLFLDEIGEMGAALQSKLLRFLQEQEYQRVGESIVRKGDVRIITATNRDLLKEVEKHSFREDLYYRIHVIPIELPPLKNRGEDIVLLTIHLLEKICKKRNIPVKKVNSEVMKIFRNYSWPGNVRELINVLEYAAVLSGENTITADDIPSELLADHYENKTGVESGVITHNSLEKERIIAVLKENNWNREDASRELGIHRTTLYRKMKKFRIIS